MKNKEIIDILFYPLDRTVSIGFKGENGITTVTKTLDELIKLKVFNFDLLDSYNDESFDYSEIAPPLICKSFIKHCGKEPHQNTTNLYWANYYSGEPYNKWKLITMNEKQIEMFEYSAYTYYEILYYFMNKGELIKFKTKQEVEAKLVELLSND